ncbi:MAG: ABC transporter permease [Cyanobacteria bacterium P01_A01_bin.17]
MTAAKKPWLKAESFLQNPSLSVQFMALGLVITLVFAFVAILSPTFQNWGWLQDPTIFRNGDAYNVPHAPPSAQHWFGTDREGHDVFARTVFGSRAAFDVVLKATLLSLSVGVSLGLLSGYLGGRIDLALLFLMDTMSTLPNLLLAVTFAFAVGRGTLNAALALSIAYIPKYYRVVRNHTVSIKAELFVEAAQSLGASPWRILSRYLALNVMQSIPVLFTLNAADAIGTLAGLGFLGLGLPKETAEWGHDLSLALTGLSTGIWWTTFFPGFAMTLMIVGLSLMGEGLNEYINPLLRRENWK